MTVPPEKLADVADVDCTGPIPQFAKALSVVPGVATVADGAAELLLPALSPRSGHISGRYFAGQQPTPPSRAARDRDAARRLWTHSAALLGIDTPLTGADS